MRDGFIGSRAQDLIAQLPRWLTSPGLLVFLVLIGIPTALAAQTGGPEHAAPPTKTNTGAPSRAKPDYTAAELAALEPLASLPAAAAAVPDKVAELMEQRKKGAQPFPMGFARTFPRREVVIRKEVLRGPDRQTYQGGRLDVRNDMVTWVAAIEVTDAAAFRIGLERVSLPEGANFLTYSDSGPLLGPVGLEIVAADGSAWLPRVKGPRAYVEVRVPRSALEAGGVISFRISSVMELFPTDAAWTDCDVDATCVTSPTVVGDLQDAVARLYFVVSPHAYLCTGTLISDAGSTMTPYLLTAHHCFSTQASATSLIAYFDYKSSTCNGTPPSLSNVPQVYGSTLLASNSVSDFTLVQLSSLPSGAGNVVLMGWTTTSPSQGQSLYSVSHPQGEAQKYDSESFVTSGGPYCSSLPRPEFVYGQGTQGSISGGSSGSALVNVNGQIVGQLYGFCYYPGYDACTYPSFNYVDGAFATTYTYVAQWLNPSQSPPDVVTDPASNIGQYSATLNATVNANGLLTTVYFDYGETASYGTSVTYGSIGSGTGDTHPTQPVSGLGCGKTYHFRARAENTIGSVNGSDRTFDTDACPLGCNVVDVSGASVTSTATYSACGSLHVGPSVNVTSSGSLTLEAGEAVGMTYGFNVASGATLTVRTCGHSLCSAGDALSAGCHSCVAMVCSADPGCCTVGWDSTCVSDVGSICGLTCQ